MPTATSSGALAAPSRSDAGDEAAFLAHLGRNHDHNVLMNVLDGTSFAIAMACILPGTVITTFLTHYTGSKFLLNLPVFISNIVFALMPFLASFVSGRFAKKKRVVVTFGLIQRITWVPVLLVIVLFHDRPGLLLPLFLAGYALFYLLWGVTSLFWRELMGRVFDPLRQTSAMGTREAVGNIAGSIAGVGVMAVLSGLVFPGNFLLLFACFLGAYSMSLVWISRLREAPHPAVSAASARVHLKSLLELPRRDPVFRWFVVFILLSYGTLFTGSLYTTIAIDRFGSKLNPDRLAGLMTLLMLLSNSAFALVLGRVADRRGRFWAYLPTAAMGVLLPIWAVLARGPAAYLALFLLLGALNSSWFIELYATLSFAGPEKRHLYLAYLSLAKTVPITIYINLGGWIAQVVSPNLTLGLSSAFCLAGLAILTLKLRPHWGSPRPLSRPATLARRTRR